MNIEEIAERLIRAAEIESVGNRVGPAPLRAQQLPYVHSDDDMRNWGHRRGERRSRDPLANACRLLREDEDAHALYRREFFEKTEYTARDISEAEEAQGWYALVDSEANRAALAAWVRCMADHKRLFFKDWCAGQDITPKTGRARKNRALSSILAHLARRSVQNCNNPEYEGFPVPPENGHIEPNIEDERAEERGVTSWASDEAFTSYFSNDPADFSWSDRRNERRRQREAKKRKQEAA